LLLLWWLPGEEKTRAQYKTGYARLGAIEDTLCQNELIQHLVTALNLLNHAAYYYQVCAPALKNRLIGSIFCKKLIYENGKYRTPESNDLLESTGRFTELCKIGKVTFPRQ
jgi:hypothetical protein